MKSKKILTSVKSSKALMITCWLIYMIAYLTRNTYNASIVHLTGQGLLTTSLAGLVSTCYFVSYGCGHLINGFLADRTRPVVMLGAGIIGTAVANVLMPVVTPNVALMIVVWTANGFFESMLWAPIFVLLSGVLTEKLRFTALSTISYSRPTGQILAYLFTAGCAYFNIGFKAPFFIAAACAVASCVLLIIVAIWAFSAPDVQVIEAPTKEQKKASPAGSVSLFKLLLTSGALIFMVPVVFHGMLKDGVNTWVPTILRDSFGVDETLSTVLAIVLPLIALLGFTLANFLLKRKSLHENHPLIGIILMGAAAVPTLVLLGVRGMSFVAGLVCLCAISLLMESFNHIYSTMMPAKFAHYGKAATVSGIMNSLIYIGSAISTYLFGLVAEWLGWGTTIFLWFCLALVGAAILALAIKPWKRFIAQMEEQAA